MLEKLGFEAAVLGNGRATTGDGERRNPIAGCGGAIIDKARFGEFAAIGSDENSQLVSRRAGAGIAGYGRWMY